MCFRVCMSVCECAYAGNTSSDHGFCFSGNLQVWPHARWTGVDEKHEWQDSRLPEQLMKMERWEKAKKKNNRILSSIIYGCIFAKEMNTHHTLTSVSVFSVLNTNLNTQKYMKCVLQNSDR